MSPILPDRISADRLPVGATGIVTAITGGRAVAGRLMEMGLLPGTHVTVTRVAPLGDPIELRLRGYALSLRKREAAAVMLASVQAPATRTRRTAARVVEITGRSTG